MLSLTVRIYAARKKAVDQLFRHASRLRDKTARFFIVALWSFFFASPTFGDSPPIDYGEFTYPGLFGGQQRDRICSNVSVFQQVRSYTIDVNGAETEVFLRLMPVVRALQQDDGSVQVTAMIGAETIGFKGFFDTLFSSFGYSGCDRLSFNQDTTVSSDASGWVVEGNFKYEERTCSNFGSVTLFNTTRRIRVNINPTVSISDANGQTILTLGISSNARASIIPFVAQWNEEIFNESYSWELPEIAGFYIEGSNFEPQSTGSDISGVASIRTRPLPKSIACEAAKAMTTAIEQDDDWSYCCGGPREPPWPP